MTEQERLAQEADYDERWKQTEARLGMTVETEDDFRAAVESLYGPGFLDGPYSMQGRLEMKFLTSHVDRHGLEFLEDRERVMDLMWHAERLGMGYLP